MGTAMGTEPAPRCGTQGSDPGGAELAAPVSRRAPLPCLPAPGDKDGDSAAAPSPPPSPYPAPPLPVPLSLLSHCSVTPGTSSTAPTLPHGQAAPAGPRCCPAAPPRGRLSRMRGAARTLPPATSAHEERLCLVLHAASRPAQMPGLPRRDGDTHVCDTAGLPNPFLPGQAGSRGLCQPPASLTQGLGHHSGERSAGRGCPTPRFQPDSR